MFASMKKAALVAAFVALSGAGFTAVANDMLPTTTQIDGLIVADSGASTGASHRYNMCRRMAKKNRNPVICAEFGDKI